MAKGEVALENKNRKMLYNHIVTYPGVSFNILKNIFDLTDGALRYHLDYLEKCEKIFSGLERGIRCYYPHYNVLYVPKKSADKLELLKLSPLQEHLLTFIKLYPGINQKELVNRTKLNRFQVSNNVNKLLDLKLVRKNNNGNKICYWYTSDEDLKYKIIKKLAFKLLRGEIDELTFLKLKRRLE